MFENKNIIFFFFLNTNVVVKIHIEQTKTDYWKCKKLQLPIHRYFASILQKKTDTNLQIDISNDADFL